MKPNGTLGHVYNAFEFLYRLIYLNLLWFSFTIIGGIIFGIGPSTVALYDVTRRWLRKELGNDRYIFKLYFTSFKQNFFAGNTLTLPVLSIYFMLLVNYRYASMRFEVIFEVIQVAMVVIAVILTIMLTYLFPMFVHYELSMSNYFRKVPLLVIAHPVPTMLNVIWVALVAYLIYQLFPYSILIGMSGLAYGVMGITYSSFVRNEEIRINQANDNKKIG
ncbi:Uncharacterized membrane protein YesL [Amphibacillus marinus]|uniref:Uncharacterized membrane protein YesL n=1 Tax=Amphibacillus marinus TaxID=872970 RepID=A0A1H8H4X3_9BACI|nr:DUF624 domain-containing protein [Amphibacillus marinus]SEN51303.1 Uncharacterized membrane protein YesL [Amphibacillus marinus]